MPGELLCRLHNSVRSLREGVILQMAEALAVAAALVLVGCLAWLWQGVETPASPAQPAAPWETAAVTLPGEFVSDASAESQFAQWLVEDLSRENGYD